MLVRAPSRITANVRRLCRKIGGVDEPQFVRVSAPPYGRLDDCFEDVRREIEKHGGSIQHGWVVWEWPGVFIEAEFHAVWRDKDGELLDVTPKRDGKEKILFVSDWKRVFSGKPIDNVRMAIGRDPRIKELLKTHEAYHHYINREMADLPFGSPMIIEGEVLELQKKATRLEFELMQSREVRRAMGSLDS
jgi:hypothetical protein